ncbi:YcnI family protein [Arthrobacter castelli]|uniref:YcnI family copper-binding membrane protein n=1 Tax=Arthrobacter castelli TaxID=271431 RepID=UPI00047CFFE8|nr:YcnI family protein [Arthrobacter castelli]
MKFPTSRALRTAAVAAATTSLMVVGAGAASAHVTVTPQSTAAGGYTHLTFNVPNESQTANTNKIKIELPKDTPFTSVSIKPVEGWNADIVRGKLPEPVTVNGAKITKAPLSVVWTAEDKSRQVSQNEYQTFSLSVGTLPEAGTEVTLPVSQIYTDGSVAKWDDVASGEGAEPESPAPSFTTTAAAGSHSAAGTAAAASSDDGGGGPGQVLGWAGLAAGLLGLIAGGVALARTRR